MNEIELKMNIHEVNKILEALGQFPYIEVHELISKIHVQAEAQLEPQKEEEPTASLN